MSALNWCFLMLCINFERPSYGGHDTLAYHFQGSKFYVFKSFKMMLRKTYFLKGDYLTMISWPTSILPKFYTFNSLLKSLWIRVLWPVWQLPDQHLYFLCYFALTCLFMPSLVSTLWTLYFYTFLHYLQCDYSCLLHCSFVHRDQRSVCGFQNSSMLHSFPVLDV